MITTKLLCTLLFAVVLFTCAVVWDCSFTRGNGGQWYPAMVTASRIGLLKYCMSAVLCLIGCLLGKAIQKIFFSDLGLRDVESIVARGLFGLAEQLSGVAVIGIWDSSTIIDPDPLVVLGVLAIWSAMHFAAEATTEKLEQRTTPNIPLSAIPIPIFLLAVNLYTASTIRPAKCYNLLLLHEILSLTLNTLFQCVRRSLPVFLMHEDRWNNTHVKKSGIRLVYQSIKLLLHIVFAAVFMTKLVPAVFIIRPFVVALARLRHEMYNIQLHATIAKKLDRWIADATEEDLRKGNTTCCICFDEMTPADRNAKKLHPCNHMFHRECIMMWLNRSLKCPYCRTRIKKVAKKRKKLEGGTATAREGSKEEHRCPRPLQASVQDPPPPPTLTPAPEADDYESYVDFHASLVAAHNRLTYRLALQNRGERVR